MREERFQFGAEHDITAGAADIEGFDAHAVAAKNQAFFAIEPDGQGEHASEAGETRGVPLQEGFERDFSVGLGFEAMAESLQLPPQFGVVI